MLFTFVTTLLVAHCVANKTNTYTSDDESASLPSVLLTHPRITKNCLEHLEGKEGAGIKGFRLKQVFIATTPGLRIPHIRNIQPSPQEPDELSLYCSLRQLTKIYRSEKAENYLKTLLIKSNFRGKVIKSAFKIFNSLPEAEQCKSQSLSSFGVLQQINLGQYLLKSYFSKLNSLNNILLHHRFAVTFGDETLFHSLNALLFGLLTEKQFLYTHIEKSSSDFSKAAKLKDTYQDVHYFVEQSFTKESHLFKDAKVYAAGRSNSIDSLYGNSVSAKDIIYHLSSSLCPAISGLFMKKINVSHNDVSNIFNLSDFYNKYLTTSSTFQSYSVSRTLSLRQIVKNWLSPVGLIHEQSTNPSDVNNDLKIVTVDDLFMLSILTALNVPVTQHVAPSSRLIIESFVPLSSGTVFQPVGQFRQMNNISLKRNDTHANKLLSDKNLIFNRGPKNVTVLNKEKIGNKGLSGSLNFVYQGKQQSSRKTLNSIPLSSHLPTVNLKIRPTKENSKNKNDVPKLTVSSRYVRVLYNGEVVTTFIPGCDSNPLSSLGLCSFETVVLLLDRTQWQQYPVRDEL